MQTKYWILITLIILGLLLVYNKHENISETNVSETNVSETNVSSAENCNNNPNLFYGGAGCTEDSQCLSNKCGGAGKCKCFKNCDCTPGKICDESNNCVSRNL